MSEDGQDSKPKPVDAPLTGEAAARKMAEEQASSPSVDEEIEAGFLDFAEHYREEFKKSAPTGFSKPGLSTQGNAVPPRWEDVSLCVDCKHCHQVTMPVNVRVPVGETGQRAALGKVRRCLLGLKLPSDDGPEVLSQIRDNAKIAPLAVECSHFSPWTDDELAAMEERRSQHQERMRRRAEEHAALNDEPSVELSKEL